MLTGANNPASKETRRQKEECVLVATEAFLVAMETFLVDMWQYRCQAGDIKGTLKVEKSTKDIITLFQSSIKTSDVYSTDAHFVNGAIKVLKKFTLTEKEF